MLPLFTAKELVNKDSKVSNCPSLTVRIFVQTERLFSKSHLIIIKVIFVLFMSGGDKQ